MLHLDQTGGHGLQVGRLKLRAQAERFNGYREPADPTRGWVGSPPR